MTVDIESEYRPSQDEPFMNDRQREYFRNKLLAWKDEILKESAETLANLQEESQNHPDLADRASSETDRSIELRAADDTISEKVSLRASSLSASIDTIVVPASTMYPRPLASL